MSNEIDMRQMARSIGATIHFPTGSTIFNKGDSGNCMYIVQSGVIEMAIGDKLITMSLFESLEPAVALAKKAVARVR